MTLVDRLFSKQMKALSFISNIQLVSEQNKKGFRVTNKVTAAVYFPPYSKDHYIFHAALYQSSEPLGCDMRATLGHDGLCCSLGENLFETTGRPLCCDLSWKTLNLSG